MRLSDEVRSSGGPEPELAFEGLNRLPAGPKVEVGDGACVSTRGDRTVVVDETATLR